MWMAYMFKNILLCVLKLRHNFICVCICVFFCV